MAVATYILFMETLDTSEDLLLQPEKLGAYDLLEEEVFLNLLRTGEQLRAGFDRLFKEHGISGPQFNILHILKQEKERTGVPTGKITEKVVERNPDVTRVIDRLQRAGLVKRRRSSRDRRIVRVKLTDAGSDLVERLRVPIIRLHKTQLAHVGESKLKLLNQVLWEARHPKSVQ
jgi:DNA-binding MarR family transcriptional regulator